MQPVRDPESGGAPVRREEAAELAAQVAGPVILPGDDVYAAERAGYNPNLVLEPALIVGVTSEADVQAAVRFAAERSLPVAVNNTGHQVVRAAQGAVLISTRRMSGVAIDSENRTARIEPGVRWGQVVNEASEVGLAPMNGSSPTVGSIGYSLGGGQSVAWSRSKGYAADHILSLDVVTADGLLRHVTAESEPELFWALRGGKGNFGAVTAMVCGWKPSRRRPPPRSLSSGSPRCPTCRRRCRALRCCTCGSLTSVQPSRVSSCSHRCARSRRRSWTPWPRCPTRLSGRSIWIRRSPFPTGTGR
jgi:FAD binding domain